MRFVRLGRAGQPRTACRKRRLGDQSSRRALDDGVAIGGGVGINAADESVVICNDGQCDVLLTLGGFVTGVGPGGGTTRRARNESQPNRLDKLLDSSPRGGPGRSFGPDGQHPGRTPIRVRRFTSQTRPKGRPQPRQPGPGPPRRDLQTFTHPHVGVIAAPQRHFQRGAHQRGWPHASHDGPREAITTTASRIAISTRT